MSNSTIADFESHLTAARSLIVRQRREILELMGFETRNKYSIESESGEALGFAAEQQKGILGIILRQVLGHWRSFEIHIFDQNRQLVYIAHHPFRFLFQRLELRDALGRPYGAIQGRFSILSKRFSVEDSHGREIMQVASPIFRLWTFDFVRAGHMLASIKKRWSGLLKEIFTDSDNFLIELPGPDLTAQEKALILAAGVFIDLMYFEHKE